jgi:hypothetical protein
MRIARLYSLIAPNGGHIVRSQLGDRAAGGARHVLTSPGAEVTASDRSFSISSDPVEVGFIREVASAPAKQPVNITCIQPSSTGRVVRQKRYAGR